MNSLMRTVYGRSGSRLERVLVSGQHRECAEDPRWLKLVILAVWIAIPVLVSRYALPTATQSITVIDMSRLAVTPPEEKPRPVLPEPSPAPKAMRLPVPPPSAMKPQEQAPAKQPPEELQPPAITRPGGPRAADVADYQPRFTRERLSTGTETSAPAAAPIRRGSSGRGAVADQPVSITRTRGAQATNLDLPGGTPVAPLRRQSSSYEASEGGGTGANLPIRRSRPSGGTEGTGKGPKVASLVRTKGTGTGMGGESGDETGAPGLSRGISFMSLEICASPQEEEDAIKAVLGAVGTRQSCRNEKGEFQFRGTQRISSFNLMIYPVKGRRPTNRCEELENAYRCLKAR